MAIITLFSLPRIVVDNQEESVGEQSEVAANAASEDEGIHLPPLAPALQQEADSLRVLYEASESIEKNTIFANSLVELFAEAERYDSAAFYAEAIASEDEAITAQTKAGDMYYEAFMRALSTGQAQELGQKVRYYYQKVLDSQPDNLDAKTKVAMTYVSSSTPMQGIQMLREVVAADENNELAVYNLGLLSMQSGQYEKAVERFQKVKEINPDNFQAQFLLGVSYLEAGEKEKSREQFEYLKTISDDPEVIADLDNYLERI